MKSATFTASGRMPNRVPAPMGGFTHSLEGVQPGDRFAEHKQVHLTPVPS
jgi:hypothetical protein